jgi:peptide/nickel transport system permease protein
LTGDLGVSFRNGDPVTVILLERLPATISLALAGIVIALLIALPAGIWSALREGRVSDALIRVASQFGVSVPDFWMGILLIALFATTLGWLPTSGYQPLLDDPGGWLRHIALPALTVGLVAGAIMTRYVRSAVLEVASMGYVRTARSKGLPPRVVTFRHTVRNALIPVLTITGIQLATILGGVIVVEVVFAWPGLGRLVYNAVAARDYPVIQGAVLLIAALFLLINLIVDVLYAVVDPRIRLS